MHDGGATGLREKALRGGVSKLVSQGVMFVTKIGSMAALGRILDPRDFGLIAMVTAVTGVLSLVKDAGLSLPTVQRATITNGQLSNLFWLNVLVGLVLTGVCIALAPVLARFYHESRLVGVTLAIAPAFLIMGLGVQHNAILTRQMRFPVYAAIDVTSVLVSAAVGIGMALFGCGYWALVGSSLATPIVSTVGAWWAVRWVPERPRRGTDLGSMLRLGGALTLNGIIIYVAYNTDKVLLGRFWGAAAVGSYGRAYQLINIPSDNLNGALGAVALSALSRLQHDPPRQKSYFLKGYSLSVALTVPVTIVCAVFSQEVVALVLGPKWVDTAGIVQLLAPTILVFALINPMFWLVFSAGMMGRSLLTAVVIAILVITAYVVGLPYGPRGVASAFSIAMTLYIIPHLLWCIHGTNVTLTDLFRTAGKPLIAGLAAGAACVAFRQFAGAWPSILRLIVGSALLSGTYGLVLLFVLGQREFYVDLVKTVFGRRSATGAMPS
jgi:O-antigen/teichoic acid export membrane protein